MNSSSLDYPTTWQQWIAVFVRNLKCSRANKILITKELQNHFDLARRDREEVTPEDLFGSPKSLADIYNENFWDSYLSRQVALISLTSVFLYFVVCTIMDCFVNIPSDGSVIKFEQALRANAVALSVSLTLRLIAPFVIEGLSIVCLGLGRTWTINIRPRSLKRFLK
ncbi:MAG: hypothetical protein EOP04_08050 [Proteobacteria bacterium]|nr:MAG: hypothetical protein EOP04_08050 [Pseudomonadota bacterium]